MSVYASPGTPLWLSTTGCNQIYFNKLSSPPFARLNQGVLYELDDGHLYFNGSDIGPTPIGNVTGPASSNTDAIALYADGTGQVIKNSIMIVGDISTDVDDPGLQVTIQAPPDDGIFHLCSHNTNNSVSAGFGSQLGHVQLINNTFESCLFLGAYTGYAIDGSGSTIAITVVGDYAAENLLSGTDSVFVGTEAGGSHTTTLRNTYVGQRSAYGCRTGTDNIAIGCSAGHLWSGAESGNVCIGSPGVNGESDHMRLGDPAVITSTFIAGIAGVSISSPQTVTIDPATGQLGSAILPLPTLTVATQSLTFTGPWAATQTITVAYVRKLYTNGYAETTMIVPAVSAATTSIGGSINCSTAPTYFPLTTTGISWGATVNIPIMAMNNDVPVAGYVFMNNSVFNIESSFTAAGNSGWQEFSIMYPSN